MHAHLRLIVGIAACLAAPALAEDKSISRPKAYTDLTACRIITDKEARLTCFDVTVNRLEQATDTREIVLLDRAEVKKAKRSLFGFLLPKLPFFNGNDDDEEEEFSKIETVFASVQPIGYGKWQFEIPDAGLWQTTEPVNSILREGQKVMIKRGAVGGYLMQLGGGGYIRVKRIS